MALDVDIFTNELGTGNISVVYIFYRMINTNYKQRNDLNISVSG